MDETKRSPAKSREKAKRDRRLAEALRANLKRRKAAARKGAGEPELPAGHVPGADLPGDERG
jgi:hypothetical protein